MEILVRNDDGSLFSGNFDEIDSKQFMAAMREFGEKSQSSFSLVPEALVGEGVRVFSNPDDRIFTFCRQEYLNLRTRWTLWKTGEGENETVYFEPTFVEGAVEESVVLNFKAHPLLIVYEEPSRDLFAVFVEKEGKKISTFYIALPNTFNDGRVCLGNDNENNEPVFVKRFERALKIFNESPFFNDDLWGKHDDKVKKPLVSSFFVDPNFVPINDPYNGKIKFVNNELNDMILAIDKEGFLE